MRIFGISLNLFGKKGEGDQAGDAAASVTFTAGASGTLDMPCKSGRFYVYTHSAPDGTVFYVGKGSGDRAWSTDRGPDHAEYVRRFCAGRYDVKIVRKDVSEEDALALEDILMREHATTLINRQNLHAPYNPSKLLAYSEAMSEYSRLKDQATIQALEGKTEQALTTFEQSYLRYLVVRDNADFDDGARSQLTGRAFPAPFALIKSYAAALASAGRSAQLAAFAVRLQRDWTLAPDDRSLVAVSRSLERSQRAKQPADASQAETPPYAPPQTLPTDWEWAKEGAETVVRLDRRLRRVGLDYLETVEPLKALRREGKNAEALALMKAAVISAEMESAKKKFGVPSFYFLEAAKACRDLGDIGQECLFLHRCDVLAQRYGRRDPDVVKRLGKAAKLLAKQGR